MISDKTEYIYVTFKDGGDVAVNGGIMPLRSGDVLRGEDVAFLMEAVAQRYLICSSLESITVPDMTKYIRAQNLSWCATYIETMFDDSANPYNHGNIPVRESAEWKDIYIETDKNKASLTPVEINAVARFSSFDRQSSASNFKVGSPVAKAPLECLFADVRALVRFQLANSLGNVTARYSVENVGDYYSEAISNGTSTGAWAIFQESTDTKEYDEDGVLRTKHAYFKAALKSTSSIAVNMTTRGTKHGLAQDGHIVTLHFTMEQKTTGADKIRRYYIVPVAATRYGTAELRVTGDRIMEAVRLVMDHVGAITTYSPETDNGSLFLYLTPLHSVVRLNDHTKWWE